MTDDNLPVERAETMPVAQPDPVSQLLAAAQSGADAAALEKVADVVLKMRKEDARSAYYTAFSAFQSELPPVFKAREMNRGQGGRIAYASLDDVERVLRPIASRYGMSYTWTVAETEHGFLVTCRLAHAQGHSETADFPTRIDTAARMNATQQVASAVQYGKRNSLCLVAGVSTTDMIDDDAESLTDKITPEQAADLNALCQEVGADREKFLKWLNVEHFSELPAAHHARAVKGLEAKRNHS